MFTWQYFTWNVCVPCARFAWHNCPNTFVCRVPGLRDNISPKPSLHRVPGLRDTDTLNICVPCPRFAWHNCPKMSVCMCQIEVKLFPIKCLFTVCQVYVTRLRKTSVCRVPDLRADISPKTSLHLEPGLRDTFALKLLCAVWQISLTIFLAKRLCDVSNCYVTQLPWNIRVPCATFTWKYFP